MDFMIEDFETRYADELELLSQESLEPINDLNNDSPNKLYIALPNSPDKINKNDNFEVKNKKRCRVSPDAIEMKKSKVDLNEYYNANEVNCISDEMTIDRSLDKKEFNYKKIPNGDFVSMTTHDGQRFYFQYKNNLEPDYNIKTDFQTRCLNLLGTSLSIIKYQIQQDSKLIRKESNILTSEATKINQDLWVDKYSPCKYQELISEEMTNRNLLHWLKLWDFCVFNKKLPKQFNSSSKKPNIAETTNTGFQPESLDQHKRPFFKVALISGPPGLGKTTLAHIVAKHAGYNVVEMNASDDRTVDIFKEKIQNATQMKSVIAVNPKPNCLIIDEIDGSPQAAINILINLIKGKDNEKTNKKNQDQILQRPIICICNDLYVPALRPLRQIAYLIYFNSNSTGKLASRLLEISRREFIKTDLTCLMALCEKAENDIRSCLNTLQFVKSDNKNLSLRAIGSLNLGQKDGHKTLFKVWHDIFTLPKPVRKRRYNPYDEISENSDLNCKQESEKNKMLPFNRFMDILNIVMTVGEDNKMMQGLFENYLECKAKDTRLDMMQEASQIFCNNDVLHQNILHYQHFALLKYLSFLPISLHFMFATHHPPKIIYPHANYDFQTGLTRSENILSSMVSDICPSIRSMLSRSTIVMQLVPYLIFVIQPNIRPVSMQLFSSREKEEIVTVVRIMRSYNLTYTQEKTQEGQFIFSLDPNVELISKLVIQQCSKQSLSYANKQMIAREIELERVRKIDCQGEFLKIVKSAESSKNLLSNHLKQNLVPKAIITPHPKQHKDFFGRALLQTHIDKLESIQNSSSFTSGIYFHFKEGFTNAVRRTVRIKDFK